MQNDDVVKRVKAWLEARPDVAPVQFGSHTRMAPSTIRHVLDGQRPCSKAMADELERVLRLAESGEIFPIGAEPVTITEDHEAAPKRLRKARDFYHTETVRRVGQVLTYCAEYARIGVVTADYGVGKTEALKFWRGRAGRRYESLVFEFDEFSCRNAVDFIECLADLLDVDYSRGPAAGGRTLRAVCAHLVQHPVLLILDQCEGVSARVMQIVRQIWDRTQDAGVGIVLLAAPVLKERLEASRMRDLGALTSRVGIWAQLGGISAAEMADVLKREGITQVDEAAFHVWHRAVGGSMRRLMASVDLAMSKHAGKPITVKTVAGLAEHLWGLSLGGVSLAEVA